MSSVINTTAGAVKGNLRNRQSAIATTVPNLFTRHNRQRAIFFTLVLLATVAMADASYMLGKAVLAQFLIERSWQNDKSQAKPWPWADTYPIAKITAPSVDLEAWVLAGATGHSLSFGPGLADGSSEPGQTGVVMIAGHRDTSFQPLEHVAVGDSIFLENESRQSFNYRITDITIADARYSTIATHTTDAILVLVTCYPFNALTAGGPLRYVVQAKLVAEPILQKSVVSANRRMYSTA